MAMRVLDPLFVQLCEDSGIIINGDQSVTFDDNVLINILNFYQGVMRYERKEFGLMLTRIIERERQKY
jgi:hypothetical protein